MKRPLISLDEPPTGVKKPRLNPNAEGFDPAELEEAKLEARLEALFALDPARLAKAVGLISRIVENIQHNPCEAKFRSLRYDSIQKRDQEWPGVLIFLAQCGFQIQNHDVVRFILEPDRLEKFRQAVKRFDILCKKHVRKTKEPDKKLQMLDRWVAKNQFRLSDEAKKAIEQLSKLKGKTTTHKLDLMADLASEIPLEFAMGDRCAQVTAERVLRFIKTGLVLDVGCGVGCCGTHLKRLSKGALTLEGLDLSSKAIVHARKTRVYSELYVGDINQSIDLPENKYDCVISSNCILFNDPLYPRPQSLLLLEKALKPGGYLIVGRRLRKETDIDVIRHVARFDAVVSIAKMNKLENATANKEYRIFVWQKPNPTPRETIQPS